MEGLMYGVLGLAMLTGQVFGIVFMFGGWQTAPKRVRIFTAVCLILMFVTIFSLASD